MLDICLKIWYNKGVSLNWIERHKTTTKTTSPSFNMQVGSS